MPRYFSERFAPHLSIRMVSFPPTSRLGMNKSPSTPTINPTYRPGATFVGQLATWSVGGLFLQSDIRTRRPALIKVAPLGLLLCGRSYCGGMESLLDSILRVCISTRHDTRGPAAGVHHTTLSSAGPLCLSNARVEDAVDLISAPLHGMIPGRSARDRVDLPLTVERRERSANTLSYLTAGGIRVSTIK